MPRKISSRRPQSARKPLQKKGRIRRRALPGQPSSEAAFDSGLTVKARPSTLEEQFSIPEAYGKDGIVLIARDPKSLYAYWEIQPKTERSVQGQLLPQEVPGLQTILRVYSVQGPGSRSDKRRRLQDIGLSGLAKNWYIPVPDAASWYKVEIGILTVSGRFLPLAASQVVATPPAGASENLDPKWEPDPRLFNKFLSMVSLSDSTGYSLSASSPAAPTPAAISAIAPKGAHSFYCRVETDLVIHGTTEPRARVFVQGQPVQVRKDGSFSLRIALPEGTRTVHVEAISADGKHTAEAAPVIMRTAVVTGTEKPSRGRRAGKHGQKAVPS